MAQTTQQTLSALPEKDAQLLSFLIEVGGSAAEVHQVIERLSQGTSVDALNPTLLVEDLILRRLALDFRDRLQRLLSDPDF